MPALCSSEGILLCLSAIVKSMYWAVRNDGNYEVIDGQQRTLSICQYVNGDFSINGLAFHNWRGFSLVNSDSCVSPVRERMGRVS